jgi:hypothetical protein
MNDFDGIRGYLMPRDAKERVPTVHEELGAFFRVSRQRIGQIEAAAIAKLKILSAVPAPGNVEPYFVKFRDWHECRSLLSAEGQPYFETPRWNTLTTCPRVRTEWCGIDALDKFWTSYGSRSRYTAGRNPRFMSMDGAGSNQPLLMRAGARKPSAFAQLGRFQSETSGLIRVPNSPELYTYALLICIPGASDEKTASSP